MQRKPDIRLKFLLAAVNEEPVPDALSHLRKGECIKAAPHMAARIAILQPPDEDLIERRPGYNPQFTQLRDSACQPPSRNSHSHPTLNDYRIPDHTPTMA